MDQAPATHLQETAGLGWFRRSRARAAESRRDLDHDPRDEQDERDDPERSREDQVEVVAATGAVVLTFLAGAEIDPASLRRHLRASLAIGAVSFGAPFVAAFLVARFVLGWPLQGAEIAGLALSTTSVAVVYAVMIESGLAAQGPEARIRIPAIALCTLTDLDAMNKRVSSSRLSRSERRCLASVLSARTWASEPFMRVIPAATVRSSSASASGR